MHMVRWPYGHIWPYLAIYGHMAIGPYATNMGKWGIPGKSIFADFGLFLHSKKGQKLKSKSMDRLWVYKSETFFVGSGHPYAPGIQPPKL